MHAHAGLVAEWLVADLYFSLLLYFVLSWVVFVCGMEEAVQV